jgi:hypothetical protein
MVAPKTRTATRTTTPNTVSTDEQEEIEPQDVTYKSNSKKKRPTSTGKKITADRSGGRKPGRPSGTTNAVMQARRRAVTAEQLAQAQALHAAARTGATQPQSTSNGPESTIPGKPAPGVEFASPSTIEQIATFRKASQASNILRKRVPGTYPIKPKGYR